LEGVLVKENHLFIMWEGEAGMEEVRDDLSSLLLAANKREFEVFVSRVRQAHADSGIATLPDSS